MNRVAMDWRTAPLAAVDAALCVYADKLTRTPHAMTAADVDALRAAGLDDAGVHDAAQVIGYFNYINRVADGLGITNEDFVRSWEVAGAPMPREAQAPAPATDAGAD
ncbi:MAG: hypothetical protein U0470_01815 [Anaerolineae bacterium]